MLLMLGTAFIVLRFSAGMGGAQMSTIAGKTLGRAGGWLMYLSVSLMSFGGAILAYIAGMGNVFASLFGVSETVGGAAIFWVLASIVVYRGLEASGKTELVLSYIMLFLFVAVTAMLLPHAEPERALYVRWSGLLSITGVSIFALGCHTIIPDVYKGGLGSYKEAKRVLVLAFLIPTALYAVFMASFLLVFGTETPPGGHAGPRADIRETRLARWQPHTPARHHDELHRDRTGPAEQQRGVREIGQRMGVGPDGHPAGGALLRWSQELRRRLGFRRRHG